jgi:hypothetical protein
LKNLAKNTVFFLRKVLGAINVEVLMAKKAAKAAKKTTRKKVAKKKMKKSESRS